MADVAVSGVDANDDVANRRLVEAVTGVSMWAAESAVRTRDAERRARRQTCLGEEASSDETTSYTNGETGEADMRSMTVAVRAEARDGEGIRERERERQ